MKYLFRDNCVGISIFQQAGVAPTITLVSIANITDSTATANVSIADGDDVSKTGVQVDTDPTFSNPTSYEQNGVVNSIAIDNLTAETTYYVRAYVIWSGQTIYSSNSLNFTTESGSLLPPELQACEWIGTDGEQDIILSNILFQNTEINITAMFDNIQGFGGWNDKNNNWFGIRNNVFTIGLISISFTDYIDLKLNFITNTFPTCTYNGNTYTATGYFSNVGSINGYHLFKIGGFNGISGKFKNYQVVSNNITYTLQPCYIKSGQTYTDNKGVECTAGTAGMYDLVNNVFYTNDGTGTFSKGADINI